MHNESTNTNLADKAPQTVEDYRDFLKNRYMELKRERKVSYEHLAKKLAVSKAYVSNVLSKRKHFSIEKISQCIHVFKIPNDRIDYFIFIAFYGISESETLKQHLFSIIHHTQIEKEFLTKYSVKATPEAVFLVSDTLTNVLMAMASAPQFQDSAEWITRHLVDKSVSKAEINKALQYLYDKKILEKITAPDGTTKFKQIESFMVTSPAVQQFAREKFHQDWMEMNRRVFQSPDHYGPRRNGSITLSLDDERMEKVKVLVKQFLEDVFKLTEESEKHQHVVHVESFFYTVARDLDKD